MANRAGGMSLVIMIRSEISAGAFVLWSEAGFVKCKFDLNGSRDVFEVLVQDLDRFPAGPSSQIICRQGLQLCLDHDGHAVI